MFFGHLLAFYRFLLQLGSCLLAEGLLQFLGFVVVILHREVALVLFLREDGIFGSHCKVFYLFFGGSKGIRLVARKDLNWKPLVAGILLAMFVDRNAFFVVLREQGRKRLIDRMMAMADQKGRLLAYPRSDVIVCVFWGEIFEIQMRAWLIALLFDVF